MGLVCDVVKVLETGTFWPHCLCACFIYSLVTLLDQGPQLDICQPDSGRRNDSFRMWLSAGLSLNDGL